MELGMLGRGHAPKSGSGHTRPGKAAPSEESSIKIDDCFENLVLVRGQGPYRPGAQGADEGEISILDGGRRIHIVERSP
jgi:hypothetical protein